MWLDYSDDGRIAIILTAPAPVVEIQDLVVRIEAQSESLKAICRMALSGEKVVFFEDGAADRVHVVLFEAGGANEVSRLSDIRSEHKNALLVALGEPITPSDFDDRVGIPLNVEEVRMAVVHNIVPNRAETASQA